MNKYKVQDFKKMIILYTVVLTVMIVVLCIIGYFSYRDKSQMTLFIIMGLLFMAMFLSYFFKLTYPVIKARKTSNIVLKGKIAGTNMHGYSRVYDVYVEYLFNDQVVTNKIINIIGFSERIVKDKEVMIAVDKAGENPLLLAGEVPQESE